MTATTCFDFLTEYLSAVRRELARRHIVVHTAGVHPPMPQQALGLSLELSRGAGGAVAQPELQPVPVPVPRERLRAGWHEELGWWAEPAGRPGAGRRWLATELVPCPDRVADYLAGLTRHEDLGTTAPAPHRYRLLAAENDLLRRLDVARGTAAPVKVGATLG
jgi:hypothetical protein